MKKNNKHKKITDDKNTINSIIKKVENIEINNNIEEYIDDKYDKNRLIKRYNNFKNTYLDDCELIKEGLKIRHQNIPEDISENIAKFIIKKYEKDNTCVWCKGVDKKYKFTGDLHSSKYQDSIEVKCFTSNGPSQFGPNKKFSVLYFLDLRKWIENKIVLWKINLNDKSLEFKNIKINKTQTMEDQFKQGRRPHIGWNKIYTQTSGFCEKIYEGTFENIFE